MRDLPPIKKTIAQRKGETPVAEPRWTLAPPPPDMTDAALLADARFVLKEQAEALAFMTSTD
jgi:hypothetical protein